MAKRKKEPSPGTRERLLEAAIDVFGRHGFDPATTRMIAKAANVNIAAIPYYFGGKIGLYQAVVSYLVEQIKAEVGELLEKTAGVTFTGDEGRQQAQGLLKAALDRFISFMLGSEQGPRFSRIFLREQMFPSPAYDIIFSGFLGPVLNALSNLIICATGESCPRKAKLRAMTLMGQVIVFRVARETIVRGLDLEGYSSEELDEIREIIMANTMAILENPANREANL